MSHASNHSKHLLKKKNKFTMAKNNYFEPNKATLVAWVNKALQQSLKKENIKSRFKVFRI
jgi:hypothetical protein